MKITTKITKEKEIKKLIYEIRGKQVMLDSDLAMLYECKGGTKVINQAVTRNLNRFPNDFYFQITKDEYLNLKSQIVTSSWDDHGGIRKLPHVFTEQGVAMLSSVLKTSIAAKVSVDIMRAFVEMKKYISTNFLEQKYINNLVLEDHDKIKLIENTFNEFNKKRKTNEIYFNGQIYDAYFKIQDIFNSAVKKLVVIDSYADNTILDITKRLNVNVIIITKSDNLLTHQDIKKYNKQYHNLKVYYDNTFHDRYFILDDKRIYHCGASINRIGYKTFSITLIGDNEITNLLINKVNAIISK